MDVDEFDNLPEGMSKDELKAVYKIFFENMENDSYENICLKLDILCDKQWHTYELPDHAIQARMRNWIIDNWKEQDDFLELALGICYCFGLDKEMYKKALNAYKGDAHEEFTKDLKESGGEFIDPYWSMPKK